MDEIELFHLGKTETNYYWASKISPLDVVSENNWPNWKFIGITTVVDNDLVIKNR